MVPQAADESTRIEPALAPEAIEAVRALLAKYFEWIALPLEFQYIERELADLPGRYTAPEGGLWLSTCAGEPAGCVAFRRWDADTAEAKRLYTRPRFQGRGLGARLLDAMIAAARQAGYRRMILDTLPRMTAAQRLYERRGFMPIELYYANPIPGALFFGRDL